MLTKEVRFFGNQVVLACDGRCDKAWGINGRPVVLLSGDDDDNIHIPDSALGVAPAPGNTVILTEGFGCKPSAEPLAAVACMNRWCTRECERSCIFGLSDALELRDLENPRPNIPGRPSPFGRDTEGRVHLLAPMTVSFWHGGRRVSACMPARVPLREALEAEIEALKEDDHG